MAVWRSSTPSSRPPYATISRIDSGGRSRRRRRSRSCATIPTSSRARGRTRRCSRTTGSSTSATSPSASSGCSRRSTASCCPDGPVPGGASWRRYGVAAAYLHDVGMVDLTPVGRRTHAQFAAHAAFGPDVTPLVDRLLGAGTGPRPTRRGRDSRAVRDAARGRRARDAQPDASPTASRRCPPPCSTTAWRFAASRSAWSSPTSTRSGAPPGSRPRPTPIRSRSTRTPTAYADPTQAFAWLSRDRRAAGRLRRRRDRRAAGVAGGGRAAAAGDGAPDVGRVRAVHRRRDGQGRVHAAARGRRRGLRHQLHDPRCAGEANIKVAFVTPLGHLRIAFHRGAFGDEEAERRAAECVAGVIQDIEADVIPSFGGVLVAGGPAAADAFGRRHPDPARAPRGSAGLRRAGRRAGGGPRPRARADGS